MFNMQDIKLNMTRLKYPTTPFSFTPKTSGLVLGIKTPGLEIVSTPALTRPVAICVLLRL